MKKILSRLIWFPVGVVLVLFLVSNRQPVSISLDPFSTENPAIATPALWLWFWLALSMLIGFFLGAAGLWMSERPKRRQAKAEHRELKSLKHDLAVREAKEEGDTLPTLKSVS